MPDRPWMPIPVKSAVWLLAAVLVAGLFRTILKPPTNPALAHWFLIVVGFATGSVGAGLIYLIAVGRRWAAILFAVLFVVGLPASVQIAMRYLPNDVVSFAVLVGQALAQLVAIVLLFTADARQWFRDCKVSRASRRY